MYDATAELLAGVELELQGPAVQLINAARAAGVPLVVISGRRSQTLNRDVGGAARSNHIYGLAFDVQVLGYTREQVPLWWWQSLGLYAERLGLRWGGRFIVSDVNHFDLGVRV